MASSSTPSSTMPRLPASRRGLRQPPPPPRGARPVRQHRVSSGNSVSGERARRVAAREREELSCVGNQTFENSVFFSSFFDFVFSLSSFYTDNPSVVYIEPQRFVFYHGVSFRKIYCFRVLLLEQQKKSKSKIISLFLLLLLPPRAELRPRRPRPRAAPPSRSAPRGAS